MKKKAKIILGILGGFSLLLSLAVAVPFLVLGVRTQSIQTDWAVLKQDPHYSQKAEVEGLSLVNQHVSCGYASIQMLSDFYGQPITEDELEEKDEKNVSVVPVPYPFVGSRRGEMPAPAAGEAEAAAADKAEKLESPWERVRL